MPEPLDDREDCTPAILEERLQTLLPRDYQESYAELEAKPMRSAGLKYDNEGRVAWDQIWGSFCDLALAGGPPHKGSLLEPARASDLVGHEVQQQTVIDEIVRGIRLVTNLPATASPRAGWVRVPCPDETTAGWLLRAITIENVAVRAEGAALDLPASPGYRIDREIKNVITVVAKTYHYWTGHMWPGQRADIAALFAQMEADTPLVSPYEDGDPRASDAGPLADAMAARIYQETGLVAARYYPGWLGVQCSTARAGIWMMRWMVTMNILVRREAGLLLLPINPSIDPDGMLVTEAFARAVDMVRRQGIL